MYGPCMARDIINALWEGPRMSALDRSKHLNGIAESDEVDLYAKQGLPIPGMYFPEERAIV